MRIMMRVEGKIRREKPGERKRGGRGGNGRGKLVRSRPRCFIEGVDLGRFLAVSSPSFLWCPTLPLLLCLVSCGQVLAACKLAKQEIIWYCQHSAQGAVSTFLPPHPCRAPIC